MPMPREAPVGHDAEAPQPEQIGAARALGIDLVAERRAAPGAAASRPPWRAREDVARVADRAAASRCETPSMSLSATLPVKPSVTITSATPARDLVALDVADELEAAALLGALAQRRVRLDDERRALDASSPLDSSADPRALDAQDRCTSAAPMKRELDEVLGRAPRCWRRRRRSSPGGRGPAPGSPARAGGCPARA